MTCDDCANCAGSCGDDTPPDDYREPDDNPLLFGDIGDEPNENPAGDPIDFDEEFD
jgi:hypothetical protein